MWIGNSIIELCLIEGWKMVVEFNINDYVWVKLTKVGMDELERQHDELAKTFPNLGEFTPPKEEGGWSKFQAWDLINRLGHLVSMGQPMPFETGIKIDFNVTEG